MKIKNLLVMTLLGLTVASCSKNENNENQSQEGQKAFATFNVKLPEITKADFKDESGSKIENTITDCKVLVFEASGKFEKAIEIDVSTLKQVEEITTGPKIFVTIINGASRGITDAEITSLTQLEAAVLANAEVAAGAAGATDVLMTSKKHSQEIKVAAGSGDSKENAIEVKISTNRAVAKAFVREIKDGIQLSASTPVAGATLVSTQFAINGIVSNAATFQLFAETPAELIKNHKNQAVAFTTAPAGSSTTLAYVDLSAHGGGVNVAGTNLLENIAGKATLNKNATMVYIKAQITPNATFTLADGTQGVQIAEDDTYFRMEMKDNSMKFFSTKDIAGEYYTANSASTDTAITPLNDKVYEHINGLNYYRVLFKYYNEAEISTSNYSEMVYSVVRNNIYDITIKSISNFGSPNDGADLVDPELPIEDIAFINATVTVEPWGIKNQTEDLK